MTRLLGKRSLAAVTAYVIICLVCLILAGMANLAGYPVIELWFVIVCIACGVRAILIAPDALGLPRRSSL